MTSPRTLPREIAPNVHWLGGCLELKTRGQHVHLFNSAFLVLGSKATLLVDTGHVLHWSKVERQLSELLGGRRLDYVLPTHPEIAHSGSIPLLVKQFPELVIVGAVRDYEWYYPEHADALREVLPGGTIDLGTMQIRVLPAPLKDMPASIWAYETRTRVMFVGDGLAYIHPRPGLEHIDEPVHSETECALLDCELPRAILASDAELTTRSALTWSRWTDAGPLFDQLEELLAANPPSLVAPAHGNPITRIDPVLPVMRESFRQSLAMEQESG